MKKKERPHQQLLPLTSWFKSNQATCIHETISLELFKSLIAFSHPGRTESYINGTRIIVSSKLIGSLQEDIRLKINPYITLVYEQNTLEHSDTLVQGFKNISSTIKFDPSVSLVLQDLLPYLYGDYTIREIASLHSSSETEVIQALQPLYEIGFLVLCSKSLVPASSFYAHLMSTECARRVEKISSINENNKESLKEILKRHLFTLYHFADSFPDHLSAAISQTANANLKEQLCSTLSESYWYSNMLLKGLMELGYSKEQLKWITPCPATLGVINYLRWLAKADLLSYAACLGILEYPEVSTDASHNVSSFIQAEWEQIEALNLLRKEALEPFRKQKKLEFLSQKSHLSKCFFEAESYLTPERQEEIRKHVVGFIQCLEAETAYIIGNYK